MSESETFIACCLCGVQVSYNAAAMCISCLHSTVDITEGINLQQSVLDCGKCGRYHVHGDKWKHMEDESAALLSHLLKKLSLDKLRIKLLDALFVWTEPHSKRLKVNVHIEKEVLDEKIRISQRVVVEFIVNSKQCIECIRESTDHTWGSLVQVRQRGGNQRLDSLEKLLIDKGLQNLMIDVNVTKEGGFDLYFKSKNQGDRVVEVITAAMPVKRRDSKKLVSSDRRNGTAKMEHTTLLEVVPINKDDLVLLTKQQGVGGRSELMLCNKLSSNIHCVSPSSLLKVELSAAKFFQSPFVALFTSKELVRYIVLDITPILSSDDVKGGGTADDIDLKPKTIEREEDSVSVADGASTSGTTARGDKADKYVLAEAELLREESSSGDEDIIYVTTHLGHILKPGDLALGYNLSSAQIDEDVISVLPYSLPDCILVKKTFNSEKEYDSARKRKTRNKRVRKAKAAGGEKDSGRNGEEVLGVIEDDEFGEEAFLEEDIDNKASD